MAEENAGLKSGRLLIIGMVVVIVILGLALIALAIAGSGTTEAAEEVDVLANSTDECVVCHRKTTPGIVEQYGGSTMAAAEVACQTCHEVEAGYPGAVEHEDTYVLGSPTTAMCKECHAAEVAQFNASRHALPAYVAYAGSKELSPEHLAMYEAIPEGSFCARQIAECHPCARRRGSDYVSPARTATTSASPPRTDPSASARSATCATSSAWNRRASQRPATTAISVRITRSGRSTRSRRTASPTPRWGTTGTGRPNPARLAVTISPPRPVRLAI